MLKSSPAARRLLAGIVSSRRIGSPFSLLQLSTAAFDPASNPSTHQDQPPALPTPETSRSRENDGEAHRRSTGKREGVSYQEEQARVLRAALSHVPRLGWSETAMILGAKDAGISPSIVGSFPRKEAALVEFFMDDCLQKLIDRIDSDMELDKLILSDRLSKLTRTRLEMQAPYISKWPQALSIQAQPANLPTSFKQRAVMIDEIWHAARDQGSDVDWYVKRTVLGGIYSTSEVYMLTDHSPGFRDTWNFLEHRIKDAFDLQKTIQEATYLAEAVGAGLGNSMQGFMKRMFQK
ncbi:ubiquinone biosynthesis protein COQ9, mitochondrial [Dioscorea cayenensis subsp. rotundata]|uniref:Ubiquinone biosynthesis protein n=1 Tax=Dioscorea cayennensis subsp. rotundata TaxID=55577 RepID=A0AB40BBL3_DIOCR|nr:ubiquinone biosynthesis protein COQ9, mitochondrial [Dioscorea cayenensis subsp. rotundata]